MNLIGLTTEGGSEVTTQFSAEEAEIIAEACSMDPYARDAFLRQHFAPEWIAEAVRATEAIGRPDVEIHLEGGNVLVRDFAPAASRFRRL